MNDSSIDKRSSFLLSVIDRYRRDLYELRRLARGVLAATEAYCPTQSESKKVADLQSWLRRADENDEKIWKSLQSGCQMCGNEIRSGQTTSTVRIDGLLTTVHGGCLDKAEQENATTPHGDEK